MVIPAYNEEEGIENVLENLKDVLDGLDIPKEIIVVDDGSTDKTLKILSTKRYPSGKKPAEYGIRCSNKGGNERGLL